MRILVTGAGGFIGRHLTPRLAALGHEVVPLRRGQGGAPADLADIGSWTGWPEGIEAIVHLGALNPPRWKRHGVGKEDLMRANAEGTKALAACAARAGTRRFVLVSSANVHASAGTRAVGEDDPLTAHGAYARSKIAAEAALADIAAGTAMETVVLRPAAVYGPGANNLTAALAAMARLPVLLPKAAGTHRRSLLSVDNAVDALVTCLTHRQAPGGVFLASDGPAPSVLEVFAQMRQALGRRALALPFAVPGLEGRVPSFVIDDTRLRRELGWHPPQTMQAGFHQWLAQEKAK